MNLHRIPRKLFVLCGSRNVGKDTVADMLVRDFGFKHYSISSSLKRIVNHIFPQLTPTLLNDTILKDVPVSDLDNKTPREILQWFGTDVMQHQLQKVIPSTERNYWISKTIDEIQVSSHKSDYIVISDVRFDHELDALRRTFDNPVCIGITRDPILIRSHPHHLDSSDVHESERGALELSCDTVISNNGTISDLHREIIDVILTYKKKEYII